jgi:hypothetical protein
MTRAASSRLTIVTVSFVVALYALLGIGWVAGAVFVLAFMVVAPGIALCRVLGLAREPDATTIIATSLALDALVTETMLYAHVWTPVRGVVALAVFTSILCAVDIARSRS